jgi:hypothetical protein
METLNLPKSVVIKEIIRYEEDIYIIKAEAEFCMGWEFRPMPVYMRADIKALSEILRLENPGQTKKIEEVVLNMLSIGEPPRFDIKEITGDYLLLCNCELVLRNVSGKTVSEDLHDLPQIVDVFSKIYTEPLQRYLNIEKEFSRDILEKVFSDFQKTFFLMDRGYSVDTASAMTQTNNPVSAIIYNKIKQQLDPEEIISAPVAQSREEILEENYMFKELVNIKDEALPF